MVQPLKVGLAGLGTVGSAVVRLLDEGRDKLVARCGRPIEVVALNARTRGKKRDFDVKDFRWVSDPVALARDPQIDAFVEVMGGAGDPAKSAVEAALGACKPVVTANNALLAAHGQKLGPCTPKTYPEAPEKSEKPRGERVRNRPPRVSPSEEHPRRLSSLWFL